MASTKSKPSKLNLGSNPAHRRILSALESAVKVGENHPIKKKSKRPSAKLAGKKVSRKTLDASKMNQRASIQKLPKKRHAAAMLIASLKKA